MAVQHTKTDQSKSYNVYEEVDYSIVIPVFNAERSLQELYERIVKTMESLNRTFEIILVDDSSSDSSWHMIERLASGDSRVLGLQLMKNSGQGAATITGLSRSKGKFSLTMDDDLQHPPEEIPKLIEALDNDRSLDVVLGVPEMKKHPLYRKLGSNCLNQLNTLFLKKDPSLRFSGFRLMRRYIVGALLMMSVPYPALGPMIISTTSRVKNIILKHEARRHGKSGYNLRKLVEQTLSNLVGYSMLPLRLLAVVGLLGILISLILSVYYVTRYYTVGISVTGWTSVLLTLLALSGFNFLAFSITGEYLLRIIQISTRTSQHLIRQSTSHQKST